MHVYYLNLKSLQLNRFWLAFAIFAFSILSAIADIFAGRSGQGANDVQIVFIFSDAANGVLAPLSILCGSNTTLSFVTAMTYEPVGRLICMSDVSGQKIVLFDPIARLNVSPVRQFNNIFLGRPRDVAIDHLHNEIIVNNSSYIFAFPESDRYALFRFVQPYGS